MLNLLHENASEKWWIINAKNFTVKFASKHSFFLTYTNIASEVLHAKVHKLFPWHLKYFTKVNGNIYNIHLKFMNINLFVPEGHMSGPSETPLLKIYFEIFFNFYYIDTCMFIWAFRLYQPVSKDFRENECLQYWRKMCASHLLKEETNFFFCSEM